MEKNDLFEFFQFTAKSFADIAVILGENSLAANLVENVEFWKWFDENFKNLQLNSSQEITVHFSQNPGAYQQAFGKFYEWDWVQQQRRLLSNVSSTFQLPTDPNNPGTDVYRQTLFGGTTEYQLKSNISGTPQINANTTPKSTIIITPEENISAVESMGYDAQSYGNREEVLQQREALRRDVSSGEATSVYEFSDVLSTIGKGAAIGFFAGITAETLFSYREMKAGKISKSEYFRGILKSGISQGMASGATTGIMIPINIALTSMGASVLFALTIAFIVHQTLAAPILAAFEKGDYKQYLGEARIYSTISEMQADFGSLACSTGDQFRGFLEQIKKSRETFGHRREEFNSIMKKIESLF